MALPISIITGFIYPPAGFAVLICMGASVGLAFAHGRAWCDFCPRGTFLDVVMKPLSPGRPLPQFLRTTGFRIFALAFVMGMMGFQLSRVWGDVAQMGFVFVKLLLATTVLGIVLALLINPRTWCTFCPMGSMASWIGRKKRPLQVSEACVSCQACDKACPMDLSPSSHKEAGQVEHGDCLKCSACTAKCPKGALSWEKAA
jgi:ferredoxin-type protein NapH